VLSLDWDRKGRVTPVWTKSQEAWPGAESGCQSPGERRSGAPEGERAPKVRGFRARSIDQRQRVSVCADDNEICASRCSAPSACLRGMQRASVVVCKTRTRLRREHAFAYPPPRSETERGRGTTEGWWRGHAEWPSFQRKSSASSRPHHRAPGEKTHLSPTPLSGCEIARCLMRLRAPIPTARVRGALARVR
jgi:hypothetical protein